MRPDNKPHPEVPATGLDVLLVNPSLDWKMDKEKKIAVRIEENIPNQESPHMGIAYLLAVARQHSFRAGYVDMVMQGFAVEQLIRHIESTRPSLVGLTAFTCQIRDAGEIARTIREHFPELPICIGGVHASTLPKETLRDYPAIDFVVCREGERILPKVMARLPDRDFTGIRGVVTRTVETITWDEIADLDNLPFPAWDMLELAKYPGAYPHRTTLELPMVASRGCPFQCTFCCRALGDRSRRRSVASVVSEIRHNVETFGCESIAFLDETFVERKTWTEEFFHSLRQEGLDRKITWSCSTRVSNVTPQLLRKMREAGCYYVFWGLESADDETLRRIKKNITIEQIRNAIRWSKEAGIIPVGAFIIGLPGDTRASAEKAIVLAEELDLYSVTFPLAVPFPGTELREMALRNEFGMRITGDKWEHYAKQGSPTLESADFAAEERFEMQKIAYRRNPKKKLDNYLEKMRKLGYPF